MTEDEKKNIDNAIAKIQESNTLVTLKFQNTLGKSIQEIQEQMDSGNIFMINNHEQMNIGVSRHSLNKARADRLEAAKTISFTSAKFFKDEHHILLPAANYWLETPTSAVTSKKELIQAEIAQNSKYSHERLYPAYNLSELKRLLPALIFYPDRFQFGGGFDTSANRWRVHYWAVHPLAGMYTIIGVSALNPKEAMEYLLYVCLEKGLFDGKSIQYHDVAMQMMHIGET